MYSGGGPRFKTSLEATAVLKCCENFGSYSDHGFLCLYKEFSRGKVVMTHSLHVFEKGGVKRHNWLSAATIGGHKEGRFVVTV